jgi:hypothetical protein
MLAGGTIQRGERVVLVATGSGLKDLRPVLDATAREVAPVIVPGDWLAIVDRLDAD